MALLYLASEALPSVPLFERRRLAYQISLTALWCVSDAMPYVAAMGSFSCTICNFAFVTSSAFFSLCVVGLCVVAIVFITLVNCWVRRFSTICKAHPMCGLWSYCERSIAATLTATHVCVNKTPLRLPRNKDSVRTRLFCPRPHFARRTAIVVEQKANSFVFYVTQHRGRKRCERKLRFLL